ncbi:hypothetical protein V1514DRAFT_350349 [Lipomyces japonicus]|uniref:uncharacterized protein n=1 Tax=Lipomyces japonicus TaxID=56871 RepID=UPI0034CEC143
MARFVSQTVTQRVGQARLKIKAWNVVTAAAAAATTTSSPSDKWHVSNDNFYLLDKDITKQPVNPKPQIAAVARLPPDALFFYQSADPPFEIFNHADIFKLLNQCPLDSNQNSALLLLQSIRVFVRSRSRFEMDEDMRIHNASFGHLPSGSQVTLREGYWDGKPRWDGWISVGGEIDEHKWRQQHQKNTTADGHGKDDDHDLRVDNEVLRQGGE